MVMFRKPKYISRHLPFRACAADRGKWRADEGKDDADGNFTRRHDDAPDGIAHDDKREAEKRRRREQVLVIRPDEQTRNVRHDQPHEADQPRNRNCRAGQERGHRNQEKAEPLRAQTQRIGSFVAQHQDVHLRRQQKAQQNADQRVGENHLKVRPAGTVQSADEKAGRIAQRIGEERLDHVVERAEERRHGHAGQDHLDRTHALLVCQGVNQHRRDERAENRPDGQQRGQLRERHQRHIPDEARAAGHADGRGGRHRVAHHALQDAAG